MHTYIHAWCVYTAYKIYDSYINNKDVLLNSRRICSFLTVYVDVN